MEQNLIFSSLFLRLSGLKSRFTYRYDNIYYCCTQKTASQWMNDVFWDPVFYKHTGMGVHKFNKIVSSYREVGVLDRLPLHTVAVHYYVDFHTFELIPKPNKYKVFFVMRDPRDVVISWYFSTLYSHPESYIAEHRQRLKALSQHEGIKYSIDYLEGYGLFWAQSTWAEAERNKKAKVFYYEDLAKDNEVFLYDILNFLEIPIGENEINELYERHKFSSYTKGRKQGSEDIMSHYRKGEAGDWKHYFDPDISEYFDRVTNKIHVRLGYA